MTSVAPPRVQDGLKPEFNDDDVWNTPDLVEEEDIWAASTLPPEAVPYGALLLAQQWAHYIEAKTYGPPRHLGVAYQRKEGLYSAGLLHTRVDGGGWRRDEMNAAVPWCDLALNLRHASTVRALAKSILWQLGRPSVFEALLFRRTKFGDWEIVTTTPTGSKSCVFGSRRLPGRIIDVVVAGVSDLNDRGEAIAAIWHRLYHSDRVELIGPSPAPTRYHYG